MPGRDLATLAKIALSLDYDYEWKIYSEKIQTIVQQSYTYSFETREFYFGQKQEHRKKLTDLYSDGFSPIYIIAIKDLYDAPLAYSDISTEIKTLAKSGCIPFIGNWIASNGVCTGVSILVNHGVSEAKISTMLADHKQQYAAKITLDNVTYFPPG